MAAAIIALLSGSFIGISDGAHNCDYYTLDGMISNLGAVTVSDVTSCWPRALGPLPMVGLIGGGIATLLLGLRLYPIPTLAANLVFMLAPLNVVHSFIAGAVVFAALLLLRIRGESQ